MSNTRRGAVKDAGELQIGEVNDCKVISLRKIEGYGTLRAFVDIRIGGSLVVRGCKVVEGKNGMFASMPRQMSKDGKWSSIVVPVDDSLRVHYAQTILKAYDEKKDECELLSA